MSTQALGSLAANAASKGDQAFARADQQRANVSQRIAQQGGCEPLPEGLSPHALRRTYASWLVAEGEDAAYMMAQLGHTDPKMALGLNPTYKLKPKTVKLATDQGMTLKLVPKKKSGKGSPRR